MDMQNESKIYQIIYSETLPSIAKAFGVERARLINSSEEVLEEAMNLHAGEIKKIVNYYIDKQLTILND